MIPEPHEFDQYQHMDPEKHFIGESLAAPSQIMPSGLVSSVGISPISAREDHVHSLGLHSACFLSIDTGQSIPNNTDTIINWSGAHINDSVVWGAGAPATMFINSGLWQAGYTVSWDSVGGGIRQARMILTSGPMASGYHGFDYENNANSYHTNKGTTLLRVVNGSWLQLSVYHTSGAALVVRSNATAPLITQFWAVRVGD